MKKVSSELMKIDSYTNSKSSWPKFDLNSRSKSSLKIDTSKNSLSSPDDLKSKPISLSASNTNESSVAYSFLNKNVMKKRNCAPKFEDNVLKYKNLGNNQIQIVDNDLSENPNDLKKITLSASLIKKSDIHFKDIILGEGGFGVVRKATWNETEVAVKSQCRTANNRYKLHLF